MTAPVFLRPLPLRPLPEVVDVQTPAPFEYERATSVEHALSLLELHGPESRIVAGGHSLLPMMKLRIAYVAIATAAMATIPR